MLRSDRNARRVEEEVEDEGNEEKNVEASEEMVAASSMLLEERESVVEGLDMNISPAEIRISNKRDATTAGLALNEFASVPSVFVATVSSLRSVEENASARKKWEVDKFEDAVAFVSQQLKIGKSINKDAIFKKFNYPSCYDVQFLQTLAVEFNVDVATSASKKRVSSKEVLIELIDKLS